MLRWLPMIIAVATLGIIGAEETDAGQTGFQPFPEAPEFIVQPRNVKRKFQECSRCHDAEDTDPEPRRLKTRHTREIDHGGNRFWCLICHDGENMDHLRTSANEKVDFDQSYLICGSCHPARQKDWYFGGHGKRVSGWQGQRILLACTQCHDPHTPAMEPRKPEPPPPVRIGLERQKHHLPATSPAWEP
jgi:cytochrome c553